jgi:two-component system OmpR family response regulator
MTTTSPFATSRSAPASPTTGRQPSGAPSALEGCRILVVDDEESICDLIRTTLGYEGFNVTVAQSGRAALEAARAVRPDLVILDVMLPDLDGFEVVRRLRQEASAVPVLFLTARDGTEDKVRGLTLGGDDYVTKPFSLEELLARIQALLRRAGRTPEHVLRFADLELDEDTHEVWRAGQPIELTATEFKLLRYLMRNARRAVSKAQILDHVWHYDFDGDANVVETYVSYLRRKLDRPGLPPLIQTLRGVGYSLRLPLER